MSPSSCCPIVSRPASRPSSDSCTSITTVTFRVEHSVIANVADDVFLGLGGTSMLRNPRVQMTAVLAVGALLGYLAASGKVNYLSTADGNQFTSAVKQAAPTVGPQAACCTEMPASGQS